MKVADRWLKDHKFLGGNDLSIADVSLATVLRHSFRLILDEKNRKNLANLTRWFEEVSNTKEFQTHFGKLWLCQKEFVPEFAGSQPAQQAEKKEEKKEEKKPKEQAPKQEKKPQAKK